jgi:hypothetical protein
MEATVLKPLTEKQRRVLDLLGEGKTPSDIANEMGIRSLAGVSSHIEALKKKGYLDAAGTVLATPSAPPTQPDISGGGDEAKADAPSGNGQHPTFALDSQVWGLVTEQANSLRAAIEGIDKAMAAHGERQAEIEAEAKAHAESIESLGAQRKKADEALSAITSMP